MLTSNIADISSYPHIKCCVERLDFLLASHNTLKRRIFRRKLKEAACNLANHAMVSSDHLLVVDEAWKYLACDCTRLMWLRTQFGSIAPLKAMRARRR